MGVRRNNLFAYFRRASVTEAYKYLALLLSDGFPLFERSAETKYLTYKGASAHLFREWARCDARPLTTDAELDTYHQRAREDMAEGDGTLFQLLVGYAEHNLRIDGGNPIVKHDDLLGWQEVTTLLGQDLLICALLAKQDTSGAPRVFNFTWPSIIPSDNAALRRVLEKGLAENHAHLFATAQYFDLTWSALTNFYEEIDDIAAKITEGISGDTPELSAKDWRIWLRRAAILRCVLFDGIAQRCCSDAYVSLLRHLEAPDSALVYSYRISALRNTVGVRLPEHMKIYDYAFTTSLALDNINSSNRALVGERYFLYTCFRHIFSDSFGAAQLQMFYVYLLIKSRFRGELVQSNKRAGYDNFSRYQKRDAIIPDNSMYGRERINLAINSTLDNGNIKSLELRVSPSVSVSESLGNLGKIIETSNRFKLRDPRVNPLRVRLANTALIPENSEPPFFFVYHLPKGKEQVPDYYNTFVSGRCLSPRNHRERSASRARTLAIAELLRRHERVWRWLRGIDSCSAEIGCRPDVLAPAIRFIAGFIPYPPIESALLEKHRMPRIGKTFHVGEDFLDLVDGLRAVDEAILFLNLGRGDRLGHAVALGLDTDEYYKHKATKITLRKQDMLDNVAWLLCRSAELGVQVKQDLDSRLRGVAGRIIHELYGGTEMPPEKFDLHNYFRAWKLRGDDPYSYYFNVYRSPEKRGLAKSTQNYMDYAYNNNDEITACRNDDVATKLYRAYHFFSKVRREGTKICTIPVSNDFIALTRELQKELCRLVAEKDIAIETNPTSNKLISTFGKYDKHPIFTFYNRHLDEKPGPQLYVSVNTDDQGVFSTSLENEYALLSRALECVRDDDGSPRYSHPQIRDWLDDVREMGMSQAFSAGNM